ncbi:hypothetical protein [Enterobacter cloacae]|uniref:hypothetical protein n=1 Tax=Enterobacter cloacae TaxID=550 RepID=UPI0039851804
MEKLNKRLHIALLDISEWKDYPPHWKTKSREKLEAMGLVYDKNKNEINGTPSYALTDEGWKVLKAKF